MGAKKELGNGHIRESLDSSVRKAVRVRALCLAISTLQNTPGTDAGEGCLSALDRYAPGSYGMGMCSAPFFLNPPCCGCGRTGEASRLPVLVHIKLKN